MPAGHSGPILQKEVPRARAQEATPRLAPKPPPAPVPAPVAPATQPAHPKLVHNAPKVPHGWGFGPYTGYRAPMAKQAPEATRLNSPYAYSKPVASARPQTKATAKARNVKPKPPEPESDEETDCGPRVRKAMEQFPGYSGEMPPVEAETTWSDQAPQLFSGTLFPFFWWLPHKKMSSPKRVSIFSWVTEQLRTYTTTSFPAASSSRRRRPASRSRRRSRWSSTTTC